MTGTSILRGTEISEPSRQLFLTEAVNTLGRAALRKTPAGTLARAPPKPDGHRACIGPFSGKNRMGVTLFGDRDAMEYARTD
jgi:hypothetical protein